ncbi:MAG: imidazolonepropionase [Anaeromyxobacteraceae bacterium]
MTVLANIGVLETCAPGAGPVERAAVAFRDGVVRFAGPEAALPAEFAADARWDAGGRLVVPGLVDCHTHVVFGGWRADEFDARLRGATYQELAARGGGIAATVRQTAALDDAALAARARGFLAGMSALGVTTAESKSGYGLAPDAELRLLGVMRTLAADAPVRLVPTLLAHVVPADERAPDRRAAYVRSFAEELVPRVARAGLAAACDVYVDDGAFSADEARRILSAARAAGLLAKLHGDQHRDGGGAALAAELAAASVDHLEHAGDAGIEALARAGTVAVTLPIAALHLRSPFAPARRLLDAGVPVAVATDFNPGTAPSYHLPLAMMLACTAQRMTPAEALRGATIVAARALGLDRTVGSLEPGKQADLAVLDAPSVAHWLYHFRPNDCALTVKGGEVVWRAP